MMRCAFSFALALALVVSAGLLTGASVAPPLPPAFTGTTSLLKGAYTGCSQTQFAFTDYHTQSLASPGGIAHEWFWPPVAGTYGSFTAPGYVTNSMAIDTWAVADTPPGSAAPWVAFQAQIAAFGQPDFVLVGLCEQYALAPSTNYAMVQQIFATLNNFVTTRKYYISNWLRFTDNSACISKAAYYGQPDGDRYVQQAVSAGLALPGPVLWPLATGDRQSDDCHPKSGALGTTTLSADATQGATSVSVAAAGSLTVGRAIAFYKCNAAGTGAHYTTITSVAGTTIGLAAGLGKACTSGTLVTGVPQAMQVHDFFDNIGTTP